LHVLFFSPLLSSDVGVKFVDKSLADLFSGLGAQFFSNQSPIVANLPDHSEDNLIFVWTPDFFVLAQTADSSESVKALILISIFHFL
jgi:hypothetical protein